jgi:hypothetical protein
MLETANDLIAGDPNVRRRCDAARSPRSANVDRLPARAQLLYRKTESSRRLAPLLTTADDGSVEIGTRLPNTRAFVRASILARAQGAEQEGRRSCQPRVANAKC